MQSQWTSLQIWKEYLGDTAENVHNNIQWIIKPNAKAMGKVLERGLQAKFTKSIKNRTEQGSLNSSKTLWSSRVTPFTDARGQHKTNDNVTALQRSYLCFYHFSLVLGLVWSCYIQFSSLVKLRVFIFFYATSFDLSWALYIKNLLRGCVRCDLQAFITRPTQSTHTC